MTELSPYLEALLAHASIQNRAEKKAGEALIQDLHPITQKAAGWYEKVRNAIDYGEGDQLRRRAVERLLKRRIIFETDEHIGTMLLEDLVTAGYIDASLATSEHAKAVDFIVKKYTALLAAAHVTDSSDPFKKWTRSMASIEIYRMLFPDTINRKAYECWMQILKDTIKVDPAIDHERYVESLRFAALRSLLQQSNPELHYAALEEAYPHWTALSESDVVYELQAMATELAPRIRDLSNTLEDRIKDPLVWYIMKKIKNSRISMELIKEIIDAYGERARDVLSDPMKLGAEVRNNLADKYAKLDKLVKVNGRRALVYILITKIAVALIVEVPLDKLIVGSVDTLALGINIVVPPLLLLIMTRWSLGFDKSNSERIERAVGHMVEGKNERITMPAAAGTKDVSFGTLAFNAFFYVITFSILIGVLIALGFHIVSLTLFLMFIALVCYFGTRVRGTASRWRHDAHKKDSFSLFARLLVFPIMRLGRWLTESFSTINFFVFFMDMIIETPFRLVLAEFNNFMNFVRDRAEDVV